MKFKTLDTVGSSCSTRNKIPQKQGGATAASCKGDLAKGAGPLPARLPMPSPDSLLSLFNQLLLPGSSLLGSERPHAPEAGLCLGCVCSAAKACRQLWAKLSSAGVQRPPEPRRAMQRERWPSPSLP